MSGVFAVLLRFVVIMLGFAAASLASSMFLHLLLLGSQDWSDGELPAVVAGSLFVSVPLVALFVAYFALLPSLAVIVAAELLGRRDWLTYALGGGAVGLVAAVFLRPAAQPAAEDLDATAAGPLLAEPAFIATLIGGGIVGGLAYWLVAGRSAGTWR